MTLANISLITTTLLHLQAVSPPPNLSALTVPAVELPIGCELSAGGNERLGGGRVRLGGWTGLNIETNPWIGTSAQVVSTIRRRMAAFREPDGPPLSGASRQRFTDKLADTITQAYVAIYRDGRSDPSPLTVVHALLFANAEAASTFMRDVPASFDTVRLGDRTVVQVAGPIGACRDAIAGHVNSLLR